MNSETFHIRMAAKTTQDAAPLAQEVLQATKKELGMVPNMYQYMANAPALLATYAHGYRLFRRESGFSPVEQEVIFLVISYENACDYCMAAHSVAADMFSKVPVAVTDAIREGREIPDARLSALAGFVQTMVNKRGNPSPEDADNFLKAGYTEVHMLYIIQAIAIKTISNYANHLFRTPIDTIFKARERSGYHLAKKAFHFFSRAKGKPKG